jgi:hypothetical protein
MAVSESAPLEQCREPKGGRFDGGPGGGRPGWRVGQPANPGVSGATRGTRTRKGSLLTTMEAISFAILQRAHTLIMRISGRYLGREVEKRHAESIIGSRRVGIL